MEWVFNPLDYKSSNPNQYKGAPNPFERTCTANLPNINVYRKIAPGVAASPPQNGIPMRSGWAANGEFSHEGHSWYDGSPPVVGAEAAKYPSYGYQHRQFVRASA